MIHLSFGFGLDTLEVLMLAVPVPPYPRTEFSPTKVAVILGGVKPCEKTPIKIVAASKGIPCAIT